MALDGVSQLADVIGGQSQSIDSLKENISAEVTGAQEQIVVGASIAHTGTLTVNMLTIATDSFVLDHPVYGEVDSPVLHIDGGYTGSNMTIPVTVPIEFDEEKTVLFTATY